MNIILLSGGSGKRLWPLSNEVRSKQFLQLLPVEGGGRQSMVQRIYSQIGSTVPDASVTVATCESQVDSIRSQLEDGVEIVTEPERRDTFPAICLAAAYLALVKGRSLDEVAVVLPADMYTDGEYFRTLKKLEGAVRKGCGDIALMGIVPTEPSSKYGYIVPKGIAVNDIYHVERFTEKPVPETAKELIADGAVWNGGVFAFRLRYVLNILRKALPFETYGELLSRYGELEKISFDYRVVERAKNVVMVPYSGEWKDLGTWDALVEKMENTSMGNCRLSGCRNTHVINELDIPVVAIDVKNIILAASADGILVSDSSSSGKLKDCIADLKQRPMYEERRWGSYRVLDYTVRNGRDISLTKQMNIRIGKNISYQVHRKRDEVWTVVEGSGELLLDGKLEYVFPGSVIHILRGQKHAIRAITDLNLIEVQLGDELEEEDIVRYNYDWPVGRGDWFESVRREIQALA